MRRSTTLLKLATMPAVKTLEQFDGGQASGAPTAQIMKLAHLAFIEQAENVLLGPSGVGKTHVASPGTRLGLAQICLLWQITRKISDMCIFKETSVLDFAQVKS